MCKSLTEDHRPGTGNETRRIHEAGGVVQRGRINGQLAVSRSFGDFFFKENYLQPKMALLPGGETDGDSKAGDTPTPADLSPDPDCLRSGRRQIVSGICDRGAEPRTFYNPDKPGSDEDWFVVIACDGIWDVISNNDACKFITSMLLLEGEAKLSNEIICKKFLDYCLLANSKDNMSMVLIVFGENEGEAW